MKYANCITPKYLSEDAIYFLNTLTSKSVDGVSYEQLEQSLCSVLSLISDYDTKFVVKEETLNGTTQNFVATVMDDSNDVFCNFKNILSLKIFLKISISFIDTQIEDNYLSELTYLLNTDAPKDTTNILSTIAIINDYNEVKSNLNTIYNAIS